MISKKFFAVILVAFFSQSGVSLLADATKSQIQVAKRHLRGMPRAEFPAQLAAFANSAPAAEKESARAASNIVFTRMLPPPLVHSRGGPFIPGNNTGIIYRNSTVVILPG